MKSLQVALANAAIMFGSFYMTLGFSVFFEKPAYASITLDEKCDVGNFECTDDGCENDGGNCPDYNDDNSCKCSYE